MSNIGDAMKTKGYMPLADDGRGAIGFTPKLGGRIMRLEKPVWFDIGQKIKDAEGNIHPITVAAYDTAQYGEYIKKGWKVVEAGGVPRPSATLDIKTLNVSKTAPSKVALGLEDGKGKEEKRKR